MQLDLQCTANILLFDDVVPHKHQKDQAEKHVEKRVVKPLI